MREGTVSENDKTTGWEIFAGVYLTMPYGEICVDIPGDPKPPTAEVWRDGQWRELPIAEPAR